MIKPDRPEIVPPVKYEDVEITEMLDFETLVGNVVNHVTL